MHGSCYLASEAFYHLWEGKLDVYRYKLPNGVVHWWLENDDGVIDLTWEQFDFRVPYELGRKAGFLTKEPSKRCRDFIENI